MPLSNCYVKQPRWRNTTKLRRSKYETEQIQKRQLVKSVIQTYGAFHTNCYSVNENLGCWEKGGYTGRNSGCPNTSYIETPQNKHHWWKKMSQIVNLFIMLLSIWHDAWCRISWRWRCTMILCYQNYMKSNKCKAHASPALQWRRKNACIST